MSSSEVLARRERFELLMANAEERRTHRRSCDD
jgi:hypothetical protein